MRDQTRAQQDVSRRRGETRDRWQNACLSLGNSAIVIPAWSMPTSHDVEPVPAVPGGDAVHHRAASRTTRIAGLGITDVGGVGQLGVGLRRGRRNSGGTQQSLAFADIALAVTVAVATTAARLDKTFRQDVQ